MFLLFYFLKEKSQNFICVSVGTEIIFCPPLAPSSILYTVSFRKLQSIKTKFQWFQTNLIIPSCRSEMDWLTTPGCYQNSFKISRVSLCPCSGFGRWNSIIPVYLSSIKPQKIPRRKRQYPCNKNAVPIAFKCSTISEK